MPSNDDSPDSAIAADTDIADEPHRHASSSLDDLDYTTTFDPTTDCASETVIITVAALTDSTPVDLPALARVIDPDALDALLDRAARDDDRGVQELWFTYAGFDIGLRSDGKLRITRATTSTNTTTA
ncbi:HalOD1 output domain-containing protein [Natrialba sp. PRR66]|uniref:HalOD1 output domain-containing protein n=1 Tax=Natrialba sp. PRR66 TaxID=3098146 RepID=UPI002B1E4221|nr:HalOD1 output domain-containing protein [Natrialba sp. PRR66]